LNVVIVGAGAVGTWFGDVLTGIGCEVTFAPRDRAAARPVKADLAVVAVKSYDTAGAILTLRALLGDESEAVILTLQNGIGNEEALAEAFGADAIMAGALTVPVVSLGNGKSGAAKHGGLALAPLGRQPHNWLIAALNATSVPLRIFQDYRALKWSKLALNILANASCAILDVPPAHIIADSRLFNLELEALREVDAVMRAAGVVSIDLPRYPVRGLLALARGPGGLARFVLGKRIAAGRGSKLPSLLIDLRAEKHFSEVSWLNGAVAGAARSFSLPAPVNAAFSRLLDRITATPELWVEYRERPEALLAEVSVERRRPTKGTEVRMS
jgi:2-dehydropantoate 2-reductase